MTLSGLLATLAHKRTRAEIISYLEPIAANKARAATAKAVSFAKHAALPYIQTGAMPPIALLACPAEMRRFKALWDGLQ